MPTHAALGSGHLSDAEFVEAFEACTLPDEHFRHADHVRLAWILVREQPLAAASDRIAVAIRRFATHYGAPGMYHDTITRAWMRLVAHAVTASASDGDFDAFLAAHPRFLDEKCLGDYYSPGLLGSATARVRWVAPDLRPLP